MEWNAYKVVIKQAGRAVGKTAQAAAAEKALNLTGGQVYKVTIKRSNGERVTQSVPASNLARADKAGKKVAEKTGGKLVKVTR